MSDRTCRVESSMLFGLLGEKLGHSVSAAMFADVLPAVRKGAGYMPFEVPAGGLPRFLGAMRELGPGGFNVTVPHKVAVLPLLDDLSPEARRIGAVNCVVCAAGRFTGHNTDAPAFRDSLSARGIRPAAALVLGTGGAARAVAVALGDLGVARRVVASRHAERAGGTALPGATEVVALDPAVLARDLASFDLVVNATPVGMWPAVDAALLETGFGKGQVVYDLVYNPRPTRLLRLAAAAGAIPIDGLEMLARQAALSLTLWTGAQVAWERLHAAAAAALRPRE